MRSTLQHVRSDHRLPVPAGEDQAPGAGNAGVAGNGGGDAVQGVQRSGGLH